MGDRLGDAYCDSEPGRGLPCVGVPFPYYDFYSAPVAAIPAA